MAYAYAERPNGFAVSGSVDFRRDCSLEVGGRCFATACRNWLEEHQAETPGGGSRPLRNARIVVEFFDRNENEVAL